MESRKEALRALTACRFCLRRGSLKSIYDKLRNKSLVPLPLQIMACVNIEVYPSDGMPSQICERCEFFISQGYQFKQLCRAADEALLQFVQSGGPLAPVEWPTELIETDAARAKGARNEGAEQVNVQVCAGSEGESDEEDEEDVLNIKPAPRVQIETEGGEEGAGGSGPARIKVTQRGGQLHIVEEGDEPLDAEDVESAAMKVDMSDMATGKFACGACDRVFPLKQLLYLHTKRQHRQRTVACLLCPDKFFTKYDLQTHMTTHSDEMPFQCIACSMRFKRYSLLKKHEKTSHLDREKFPCGICSYTFLSQEELTAHTLRHRDYDSRRYICPATTPPCSSRFQSKATLRRHMELIHKKSNRFCCNYCDQKFSTQLRLARHVKEHAGSRPYPCKFCSKTFIKSHHYTRHLRMNHGQGQLGTASRGQVSEIDVYYCSDCGEAFNSQELLAYHEAQHTAQNLTCPLCQEHFADVDAVTEHIKLHADQEKQFVCAYCELVFVSEVKLDQHTCDQHSDELDTQDNDMEEDYKEEQNHSYDVDITGRELPSLDTEDEEMDAKPAPVTQMPEEEARTDGEEATYTELATVDTLRLARMQASPVTSPASASSATTVASKPENTSQKSQTAGILRKAEEVKRRAEQERIVPEHSPNKMPRPAKFTAASPTTFVKKSSPDKKLLSPEKKLNEAALVVKQKLASLEKQKERQKVRSMDIRVEEKKTDREDKKMREETTEEKMTVREDNKDKEEKKMYRDVKRFGKEHKRLEREDRKSGKEDKKPERDEKKMDREDKKPEKEERKIEREETPSEKSLRILERDLQELKRQSSGNGRTPDTSDKPVQRGRGRPPLTAAQRLERMRDKAAKHISASAGRGSARRFVLSSRDKRPNEEDRDSPREKTAREFKIEKDNKEYEDTPTRRSSRASRVKDYAKMIRDSADSGSSDDDDDSEDSYDASPPPPPVHTHVPKRRGRPPKNLPHNYTLASTPFAHNTPYIKASPVGSATKRRGRPRLSSYTNSAAAAAPKKMRSESEDKTLSPATTKSTQSPTLVPPGTVVRSTASNVVLTHSGQTLTKVPVKALPPGVKPRPLPAQLQQSVANAARGSICEMRMGEKTVKVQKIVMTKAEVDEMYRKGMLEMKHGTMVLKAPKIVGGTKMPMGDPNAIRSFVRAAAAATPAPAPTPDPVPSDEPADSTQPETVAENTTAEPAAVAAEST